jgi:hypothetical protein
MAISAAVASPNRVEQRAGIAVTMLARQISMVSASFPP